MRHRRQLSATVRYCDSASTMTPCVDVKVRGRLYDRLSADVRDQDPDSEIYNNVVEQWWDMVPQELADTFLKSAHPGSQPKVYPDGRSSGWCCVAGIGVPEEGWTVRQLRAWQTFEDAIYESMTDYEAVYADTVRVNQPTVVQATAPHGRCATKGRCIEPVPREEKCR